MTVQDIMQTAVVTASPEMTVRQFTRLLADEEISGAPVVDGAGCLVGVASASDVVRFAAANGDVRLTSSTLPTDATDLIRDPDEDEDQEGPDPYGFFLPEDSPVSGETLLEQFAEDEFDSVTVEEIMTAVSFSVHPSTSIDALADFLTRGRIHRAVVVADGRLVGIVTSSDVLKAVADGRIS
ncbi:MAG: CBS domain-containing protein [Gemmatimonadota bacterium]|nr:CBS domain-containing protein [Gemmatimonadota bacterium]